MFLPNSALPFCHLRAESVHRRAACFCPQHVDVPDFPARQLSSKKVLLRFIWGCAFEFNLEIQALISASDIHENNSNISQSIKLKKSVRKIISFIIDLSEVRDELLPLI